jgi:hypothetical protein
MIPSILIQLPKLVVRSLFAFFITLFFLMGSIQPLEAQREQFVVRTEFAPSTQLGFFDNIEADQVRTFSQFIAFGKRSVLDKKGTAVLTSTFSYRHTHLDYNIPTGAFGDNPNVPFYREINANGLTLHQIQADFLYMKVLNKKWMLYALGRPAMMSDLEDITIEDFRFEAAVFTEYGFSRKFRGGLGLSRSSAFGRVLWIPLARILYRPQRKILIDGILPSRLDAWYIPSKKWELGVGVSLIGGQFSVSDQNLGGNQFGWANGIAAFQVKRLVKGKWYAQLDAGFSIIPRQELTDYNFRLFPSREILSDLDPDPMPVFRFGFFKVF